MEEDCTVTGKITGFNKMIGTQMKTINAQAKIINTARREAGKDKQQLFKDAALIKGPQASCATQEQIVEDAILTLLENYPDELDAIETIVGAFDSVSSACWELMYFGTEEDIKLNATNNLNNINDQRLFAQ